jgi:hypothetical protein
MSRRCLRFACPVGLSAAEWSHAAESLAHGGFADGFVRQFRAFQQHEDYAVKNVWILTSVPEGGLCSARGKTDAAQMANPSMQNLLRWKGAVGL